MGLIDDVVRDIADLAGGAITNVSRIVEQDSQHVLLRRFRRSYPKLSIEETIGIRDSLGHTKAEQRPCRICRIMATEEYRLAQEQD